jgi:hypothetical protein
MNRNFKEIYKQKLYEAINRKMMREDTSIGQWNYGNGGWESQNQEGDYEFIPDYNDNNSIYQGGYDPLYSNTPIDPSKMLAKGPPKAPPPTEKKEKPKTTQPIDNGDGSWTIDGVRYTFPPDVMPVRLPNGQIVIVPRFGKWQTPGGNHDGWQPSGRGEYGRFRTNPINGDIDIIQGTDGRFYIYQYVSSPFPHWEFFQGGYQYNGGVDGEERWRWYPGNNTGDFNGDTQEWYPPGWPAGPDGKPDPNAMPFDFETIPWRERNLQRFNNPANKDWLHQRPARQGGPRQRWVFPRGGKNWDPYKNKDIYHENQPGEQDGSQYPILQMKKPDANGPDGPTRVADYDYYRRPRPDEYYA